MADGVTKLRLLVGQTLFDELAREADVSRKKQVEGRLVRQLREEVSGRPVSDRDGDVGMAFAKRRRNFFKRELEIGGGGDAYFASAGRAPVAVAPDDDPNEKC